MQSKFVAGFLVFLLFVSAVYAVGSSTGSSSPPAPPQQPQPAQEQTPPPAAQSQEQTQGQARACEDYASRTDRIKCRLENKTSGLNVTEESCRDLQNPGSCQFLYAQVNSCYTMTGVQKDQCFKRVAGFAAATVRLEESKASIRNYIVFLLYDLQERVEKAYDSGKITSQDATDAISLIVEIKQDIMNGKPKTVLQPKIEGMKSKIRSLNL